MFSICPYTWQVLESGQVYVRILGRFLESGRVYIRILSGFGKVPKYTDIYLVVLRKCQSIWAYTQQVSGK